MDIIEDGIELELLEWYGLSGMKHFSEYIDLFFISQFEELLNQHHFK